MSEGDAALMAHELNSIVSRQDVALYGVPDEKTMDAGQWSLVETQTHHIGLKRQSDGRWRFDAQTVRRIPAMRNESARGQRETQESRMKLAEGRTDPEATMRTFLIERGPARFHGGGAVPGSPRRAAQAAGRPVGRRWRASSRS